MRLSVDNLDDGYIILYYITIKQGRPVLHREDEVIHYIYC